MKLQFDPFFAGDGLRKAKGHQKYHRDGGGGNAQGEPKEKHYKIEWGCWKTPTKAEVVNEPQETKKRIDIKISTIDWFKRI